MTRYEPYCDCLGGHVSMLPDPNGRWCRADEVWTPQTNTLPWAFLTIEQMRQFEASCGELERLSLNGEWMATDTPLSPGLVYRIRPTMPDPTDPHPVADDPSGIVQQMPATKPSTVAHVIADMMERAGEPRPNGDILADVLSQVLPATEADLRAEVERLRAIVAEKPTHRHIKRGTLYRRIGSGRIQSHEPLPDNARVEIYVGPSGDLWARRYAEFHDGRFAALSSEPDGGQDA